MTVIEHEVVEREALDTPGEVVEPLFLQALELLRKHGWCQHEMRDTDGRVCLLGAVNTALSGNARTPFFPEMDGLVKRLGFEFGADVTDWNDTPDRDQREVEELLERRAYGL